MKSVFSILPIQALALFIRIYYPFQKVFSGDIIKFTSNDAYYHMRLIDNLAANYPYHTAIDPYFIYSTGTIGTTKIYFFDWLLASIAWLIGSGHPSQHLIDTISVYYPVVLAALTIIPVYFIGKILCGNLAGVFAAVLVAILPGEFLGRSILGFTDYHVMEVLLTTTTMLFLILALKAQGKRVYLYSILAGAFLGLYVWTWAGALLFVFVIFAYFVVQSLISHYDYHYYVRLLIIASILFATTLLISWPSGRGFLYTGSLLIALLFLPIVFSYYRVGELKRRYYYFAFGGLSFSLLALLFVFDLDLLKAILNAFKIFIPTVAQQTTTEVQGLFSPVTAGGGFFSTAVWGNFNISLILATISLVILIYLVIKYRGSGNILLLVWTLIILAVSISQRRFAYYLVINVSLLAGYLLSLIINKVGIFNKQKWLSLPNLNIALSFVLVLFIVFIPNLFIWDSPNPLNITSAPMVASQAKFTPSDDWYQALLWMQDNTPEPFGDADSYIQRFESLPQGQVYEYPATAYGVLTWWDYGYWVTRIAHRIPAANGSQYQEAVTKVAEFFLSQDEEEARQYLDDLGAKYIIVDRETTTSKFPAIPVWIGEDTSQYFEVYRYFYRGQFVPVLCFYPEYYRTMASRLYNFGGEAVNPTGVSVIQWEELGNEKYIIENKTFCSYEDAKLYLSHLSGNYRIVGYNPSICPIPLAILSGYQMLYGSGSLVKIFDVTQK